MKGANGFFPYDDILNEEQRNDIQDFFADTLNTERVEDFTQFIGPVDKSKKTAETHHGPSRIINLGIAKDGILPSA